MSRKFFLGALSNAFGSGVLGAQGIIKELTGACQEQEIGKPSGTSSLGGTLLPVFS